MLEFHYGCCLFVESYEINLVHCAGSCDQIVTKMHLPNLGNMPVV